MFEKFDWQYTWRKTIPKRMPQAMSTFSLSMTIVTPPNCPRRFITTNKVAKNQPHPQEISIYSLCSDHWTHIRMPSSKNVETKHRRAKCGRTCFDERVTYRKEILACIVRSSYVIGLRLLSYV